MLEHRETGRAEQREARDMSFTIVRRQNNFSTTSSDAAYLITAVAESARVT